MDKLENIGSFAGYVRRPTPKGHSGYVANFFGDNGKDADTITVLSLTRFQNMEVYIRVYWIKNAVGEDMRSKNLLDNQDDRYPLITEFTAYNNRPIPHRDGMLAQLFAHNGEDADAVNLLGHSKYVDSLVYVDMFSEHIPSDNLNIYDSDAQQDIVANHAWKLAEAEKREYERMAKKYLKANVILHESKFLHEHALHEKINEVYPYIDFLKTQKCAVCGGQSAAGVRLRKNDDLSFVPVCEEHRKPLLEAVRNDDYSTLPCNVFHLEMREIRLKERWAWQFFIETCSLTGHEEPDSVKIMDWVNSKGIKGLLPTKFIKQAMGLETLSKD